MTTTLATLDSSHVTLNESARLKCEAARQLKDRGLYEKACDVMRPFWNHFHERPNTDGLHPAEAAELLFVVGILRRWIGGKHQIKNFSDAARDLISESLTFWESEKDLWKAGAAQSELGWCYWRSGALSEARIMFTEALKKLTTEGNTRADALLGLCFVEWSASRYYDALAILTVNAGLFARITNLTTKGNAHNQRAMVLRSLATAEERREYFEQALREYQEADHCFELARHTVFRANVKNNVGVLLLELGRFKAADAYFTEARRLATIARDRTLVAQFDDSRAKLYLATNQLRDAETAARCAVEVLDRSGRDALLADTLITYGIALARMQNTDRARFVFQRAIELARNAGSLNTAGLASLTLIEEIDDLPAEAFSQAYEQAGEWLSTAQSAQLWQRFTAAGTKLARKLRGEAALTQELLVNRPCRLPEEVLRFEQRLIRQALASTNGKVTHAARRLGIGRQRLAYTIESKHPDLLAERSPVMRRPRSRK